MLGQEKEKEEPSDSVLHFQETPASEMDETALLMCVVSLRKAGGQGGGNGESQALISSAYL